MTTKTGADALVVFGISGDLAKKMTYISLYRLEETHRLECKIIGVAKDDWGKDKLVQEMHDHVTAAGVKVDEHVFGSLANRISFISGDFLEDSTYDALTKALHNLPTRLFYLEVPPSLFAPVAHKLSSTGLANNSRVLFEKPFGHDLESAVALNAELHKELAEDQILRIDHFLGKQPVLDLQFLRFSNAWLEPLLSREHISAIQINMTEDFGVEDRGAFYDPVGAVRDVVQNHLMQVLALAIMDAPTSSSYDALWDRKVDVYRAMPEIDPRHVVRGQYDGYLNVPGVAPHSHTETYVALRLELDSWRWSGVPIFLRAGKALQKTATELRFVFNHPPRLPYLDHARRQTPNQLILRIDPDPGLRMEFLSQSANESGVANVTMDLPFAKELGRSPEPYERLLGDAIAGDRSLFSRQDAVEETWRIINPALDDKVAPVTYQNGSWGPSEADEIVRGHLGWQVPWTN